ncbi:MAG: cation transporter [Capnocytophaga sp.]|nr:cation transporter [Capnocytophaga sp.]
MNTFEFKTNFKCQGCVDKVAKELDKNELINSWKVDLSHPDKILRVETSLPSSEIQKIIEKAGYKAEEK